MRKPFQGILNIIYFNWHFYVIGLTLILLVLLLSGCANPLISIVLQTLSALMSASMLVSLVVSFYVYDLSGFYNFEWIKSDANKMTVININAGFDETSELLKKKFINADFLALDFYNPAKHTELSIMRARKRYPPFLGTIAIDSSKIDLNNNSIDKIFVILSAHEIRDKEERIAFFSELSRLLKPEGQIVVIEHLRDIPNFIAYTIGSFHFYSKLSWLITFEKATLSVVSDIKHTPFISIFTLEKNGRTL